MENFKRKILRTGKFYHTNSGSGQFQKRLKLCYMNCITCLFSYIWSRHLDVNKRNVIRFQEAEIKFVWRIKKQTKRDENQDIWKDMNVETLENTSVKLRVWWCGHKL
jgi:hypothetical protein